MTTNGSVIFPFFILVFFECPGAVKRFILLDPVSSMLVSSFLLSLRHSSVRLDIWFLVPSIIDAIDFQLVFFPPV